MTNKLLVTLTCCSKTAQGPTLCTVKVGTCPHRCLKVLSGGGALVYSTTCFFGMLLHATPTEHITTIAAVQPLSQDSMHGRSVLVRPLSIGIEAAALFPHGTRQKTVTCPLRGPGT